MTSGNISVDEIKQFASLNDSELYTLRSIYINRLNQINKELKNRQKRDDVSEISINMMNKYGHCTDIFKLDSANIINKFERDVGWSYNNRKVPNETLSLATMSIIYDKYNIEYNPYTLIDLYDLDGIQFNMLYAKLKDWADKNYWHK